MVSRRRIVADDETIRNALEHADPLILCTVVYQLTNDEALAELRPTMAPFIRPSCRLNSLSW
jgi:hypothetical protein